MINRNYIRSRPFRLRPRGFVKNMLLAIDVGNTQTVVGVYEGEVLAHMWRVATNIEVVDREGRFIGGVIAPGVDTSAAALFSRATRLAAIDLVDPHTAIGGSTEQAIQAGIVYGEADRVDGLVRRIFAQLGYEAPVVATGGLAPRVAELSQTITATNPELTLEGLRLIHEAQGKGTGV